MRKDNLALQNFFPAEFPRQSSQPTLATLAYADPHMVRLRDGEVVVYRRTQSPLWQCRYKLQDGSWYRTTTHHASLERAVDGSYTVHAVVYAEGVVNAALAAYYSTHEKEIKVAKTKCTKISKGSGNTKF